MDTPHAHGRPYLGSHELSNINRVYAKIKKKSQNYKTKEKDPQ
jgi:hypothetical protein